MVSIENNFPEVLVSVGKFLFELHLSSMLLNKPLDDTVIRAQSTFYNEDKTGVFAMVPIRFFSLCQESFSKLKIND